MSSSLLVRVHARDICLLAYFRHQPPAPVTRCQLPPGEDKMVARRSRRQAQEDKTKDRDKTCHAHPGRDLARLQCQGQYPHDAPTVLTRPHQSTHLQCVYSVLWATLCPLGSLYKEHQGERSGQPDAGSFPPGSFLPLALALVLQLIEIAKYWKEVHSSRSIFVARLGSSL